MNVTAKTEPLQEQAISIAQQAPVSNLDAQLPNRPFVPWFNGRPALRSAAVDEARE